MIGRIKWFDSRKGYGFITGVDKKDYFFHCSDIPKNLILYDDKEIEFTVKKTLKGVSAENIK